MGNCMSINKKSRSVNKNSISPEDLCKYPRTGTVKIRFRNYLGKITNEQMIDFKVTEPSAVSAETISLESQKAFISLCVLPGLDTKCPGSKTCQDYSKYLFDEKSIFISLFDGHGSQGEKVVVFCQKIVENLYTSKKVLLEVFFTQNDPKAFISELSELCDKELLNNKSEINANFSGW